MTRTNGELNIMFQNLEGKVDDNHRDMVERLERIENQTTRTNGRVNELERWKWTIIGAVSILTTIVLPLVLAFFKQK